MSKDLYILIGPPGVGKSTWVQKHFQGECVVVSSDNILEEIAAETGTTYNETFNKYMKAADRMMWEEFDRVIEERHHPVVFDRTNMSRGARARVFNRLKQFHRGHGYTIHAVVIPKPDEAEHKRRLASRPGKTIPENVVESMIRSFEFPSVEEGFDSILIIED